MREVSVKTVPARANISKAKNGVNHKTTNQSLSINIIPFKHPVVERAFSFSKEKKDGYYPIHRAELPKSIWEEYEDDLQDIKYLYSNFQDEENADFSASVNFKSSSRFAKHYYTTLIHEYFSTRADAIKKNYVGDIQLWFKNESLSNEKINAYEKYTIKVEFSSLCHSPAVLLTYDGVSKVSVKSIAEINIPTENFKTILFRNQVTKFKYLSEEAKQNLTEAYPLLSTTLKDILRIPQNRPSRANKYKPYFKNINEFYATYLNNDDFRAIVPLHKKGFYNIHDNNVFRINYNSNYLKFYNGTEIDPQKGMKNLGPYKTAQNPNNISFFFIYHKPDRTKAVAKLFNYFNNGYQKNGYTVFKPLKEYIKQPFHIDKEDSIAFESPETAIKEIKQHLIDFTPKPNTQYVAIYVSPVHKTETDSERIKLYYRVKEELLKHSITSQVIYKDNIYSDYFNYFLPNIAIALLAKIGGIPWRLDREPSQELIVGVGAFNSLTTKSRYVGSAICFNNEGEFKGFDCFRNNEMDLLVGAIRKQILTYLVTNGENAKRLIIHYYKLFSKDELDPVQKMLGKLGLDIPVIVVTINKTESRDYVAFDTNSDNLMPLSGTIIDIAPTKHLLFNNTRYNENGYAPKDNPFPVKLNLFCSEEGYFDNPATKKEIIDQVYQFSRMYWKSVKQQNLPVTIKYPEMVAQVFPFFEADKLEDFAKNNLWFL